LHAHRYKGVGRPRLCSNAVPRLPVPAAVVRRRRLRTGKAATPPATALTSPSSSLYGSHGDHELPPSDGVPTASVRSPPSPLCGESPSAPPHAPVVGRLTSLCFPTQVSTGSHPPPSHLPPSSSRLCSKPVSPAVSHTCVGRRRAAVLDLPPPEPALPRCWMQLGRHHELPHSHGPRPCRAHGPLPWSSCGPRAFQPIGHLIIFHFLNVIKSIQTSKICARFF
jgi:hypothetical protein